MGKKINGLLKKSSILTLFLSLFTVPLLHGADPVRIIVLPADAEKGTLVSSDPGRMDHYRRTMRFINNQLVLHGFEVVNPVAKEAIIEEYDRLAARPRTESKLACVELCRKYDTDAAYIVWLDVQPRKTKDGYCNVKASIEGEGYDSAGRDLGSGLAKVITLRKRNCQLAVSAAEKEIGDIVGRTLTGY